MSRLLLVVYPPALLNLPLEEFLAVKQMERLDLQERCGLMMWNDISFVRVWAPGYEHLYLLIVLPPAGFVQSYIDEM